MSGFSSWYEMELYAQTHEKDLKKLYIKLTKRVLDHYTPSHDTFSYVFRSLDPVAFQGAFQTWLEGVFSLSGQHIVKWIS